MIKGRKEGRNQSSCSEEWESISRAIVVVTIDSSRNRIESVVTCLVPLLASSNMLNNALNKGNNRSQEREVRNEHAERMNHYRTLIPTGNA